MCVCDCVCVCVRYCGGRTGRTGRGVDGGGGAVSGRAAVGGLSEFHGVKYAGDLLWSYITVGWSPTGPRLAVTDMSLSRHCHVECLT